MVKKTKRIKQYTRKKRYSKRYSRRNSKNNPNKIKIKTKKKNKNKNKKPVMELFEPPKIFWKTIQKNIEILK